MVRLIKWLIAIIGAVGLVIAILGFQVMEISSNSMENSLHDGNRVVVSGVDAPFSLWNTSSRRLNRGQIVVFYSPPKGAFAIKRIVGIAGDRLFIDRGQLVINGKPVSEPYVSYPGYGSWPKIDEGGRRSILVPEGHYFVLGDNRPASKDSRSWGTVPESAIVGIMRWKVPDMTSAPAVSGER